MKSKAQCKVRHSVSQLPLYLFLHSRPVRLIKRHWKVHLCHSDEARPSNNKCLSKNVFVNKSKISEWRPLLPFQYSDWSLSRDWFWLSSSDKSNHDLCCFSRAQQEAQTEAGGVGPVCFCQKFFCALTVYCLITKWREGGGTHLGGDGAFTSNKAAKRTPGGWVTPLRSCAT